MIWRTLFPGLFDTGPQRRCPVYTGIPAAHRELWDRLEALELDDASAEKPFSLRLAEQQTWPLEFARRAIDEYKKFLFLCMTQDHVVSPSLTVDEVWHLHLQYTESYLEDLCVYTLRRIIHHMPSKGGKREARKHQDLYALTLEAYRRNFGEPPADIWGPENWRNLKISAQCAARKGKELDPETHTRGDQTSLLKQLEE